MTDVAKSLFSQLFEDSPEPPRTQARTRPTLAPQAKPTTTTNGATVKPVEPRPASVSRPAPPPSTTTTTAKPAQMAVSSKQPRGTPLIKAKNFVQLEASEASDDDDEPSLSEDDEDELAAALADDSDEYAEEEEEGEDEDDEEEAYTRRSRRPTTPKKKKSHASPAKPGHAAELAKREAELKQHEADLKQREADQKKREAELAHKEAQLGLREKASAQKEYELIELHHLVQQHHRSMMEQQAINQVVSDALDSRLKVLEAQEAKANEQPPVVVTPTPTTTTQPTVSLVLPQRVLMPLERGQVEQLLPPQLVAELNYVSLSRDAVFDLHAYRSPSDQAGRDLISIDVIERGTGRFVYGQTRWPL